MNFTTNHVLASTPYTNDLIGSVPPARYGAALRDLNSLNSTPSLPRSRTRVGEAKPISFWRESLALMERHLTFGRQKVKEGDSVYQCGQHFDVLYLVNSGLFEIINLAPDGREQAAGVYFKGDWLGFDGIPNGVYGCDAIALDIGEIWTISYETLLQASAREPVLMRLVLAAISEQLIRNRNAALSMGTLGADARVADFLLEWANSLAERGVRTDQINVHMTRSDIGKHLGLRLESVSRALSRLAHDGVIQFNEKGRRDICIPSLDALRDFIQCRTDMVDLMTH